MIKPYVRTILGKGSYEYNIHRTNGLAYAAYLLDFRNYSGTVVPLHWHNEFEICILIEGCLKISVEGKEMILSPGEAVFINSNRFHSYSDLSDKGSKFFAVAFSGNFITENSFSNPLFLKYIKPLSESENISSVFFSPEIRWQNDCIKKIKSVHLAAKEEKYFYEFSIKNSLSEILGKIFLRSFFRTKSGIFCGIFPCKDD